MDLWIRSQDRLGNYKSNSQVIREIGHEDKTTEFIILNENKISELLGTYKTKERALEVLDEIQSILKPKLIITDTGNPIECSDGGYVYLNQKTELKYQQIGSYVYEMPKE